MENIPIKYKDEKINMRHNWKLFCDKLLANISQIEATTHREMTQSRNRGEPYEKRKILQRKLELSKKYREITKKSADEKILELQDGDEEIIQNKGWDYYFSYVNCGL